MTLSIYYNILSFGKEETGKQQGVLKQLPIYQLVCSFKWKDYSE